MSSNGSNVYPDIIVFPPDQVADITDEHRPVLIRFKDFLRATRAAHSVPDAAGTMKSQMRKHLIQRLWDGRSKGTSLPKQKTLKRARFARLLLRRGARQEADQWMVSEQKQSAQDCAPRSRGGQLDGAVQGG